MKFRFKKRGSRLLGISGAELAEIGRGRYGGKRQRANEQEVDEFCARARLATIRHDPDLSEPEITLRTVARLHDAGGEARPWGVVGAFAVAFEITMDDDMRDPAYVDLMRAALIFLRSDGLPYNALPREASSWWTATFGSGSWPTDRENPSQHDSRRRSREEMRRLIASLPPLKLDDADDRKLD